MDEHKPNSVSAAQTASTPEVAPITPPVSMGGHHGKSYLILGIAILLIVAGVIYVLVQKGIIPQRSQTTPGGVLNVPGEQQEVKEEQEEVLPEQYVRVEWRPKWQAISLRPEDTNTKRVLAGKITEGPYSGSDLNIEIRQELGTSFLHYVVVNSEIHYLYEEKIKILGIDNIPEEISFPGSNYKLHKTFIANDAFADIPMVRKVFTDPKLGDVYLSETGCLVVELPDHTAISYDFTLPFISKDTRALLATFQSGNANSDPYNYNEIIGCGALCFYLAQKDESELKPFQRLTEVGKLNTGEKLYGIKDPNDPVLKALYNDENTVAYYNVDGNYEHHSTSRYTYKEFIAARPLLYWVDPLGRWIELKNERFQVAAEMCKPVIYLYPQSEAELSVQVNPNGGFTYTNPPYGLTGWRVKAHPDGSLDDLSSNQTYPYLFWEGIGLNYPPASTGFIVKRKDIDKFLTEKIQILGLRGREADDFKEYWVKRLVDLNKPYVKIAFLKKEQFDELAPLSIGPDEPNTVIRVMMTAEGLDKFEKLPEQQLTPPPARVGFTLVEWGGVVLK